MSGKLTEEDARRITKWLKAIGLQSAYWPIAFADACQMARILKKMNPHLVNLHLFQHRLNTDAKLMNWELLNRTALEPINMAQSKETLKKMASGTPGVVEQLLLKVMKKYVKKHPLPSDDDEMPSLSKVEKNIDAFVREQELVVKACLQERVAHKEKQKESERIDKILKKLSYMRRQTQDLMD